MPQDHLIPQPSLPSTPLPDPGEWVSVRLASMLSNVSEERIEGFIADGKVRVDRINGARYLASDDVERAVCDGGAE